MMKNNVKYYYAKVAIVLMGLLATTMTRAQMSHVAAPVEVQTFTSADDAGVSNSELLKSYIQQRFDEMLPTYKKNLRRSAATQLSGNDLRAYNYLKGVIQNIAKGKTATGEEPTDGYVSTAISIPLTEITSDIGPWTAADLGVEAIVVNNAISNDATAAASAKVSFDYGKVVWALMADCPYELYWYDKTKGCTYKAFDGYSYNGSELSVTGNSTLTMKVAQEYAIQEGNQYYPTRFNTATVASVDVAIDNAKAIAESATGTTTMNRLLFFKDKICELTSYNSVAAGNSSYPYGDPWQLVWVFDGITTTNVVCEGYSKAFKYLCDLSGFKNAECLIATGTMGGGTGAGRHMWNVMKMDDGRSYLVDVTNCDEGTIGAPDLLFMAYNPAGSYDQTYTFPVGDESITYTYDDNTKAAFSASELTISGTKYQVVFDIIKNASGCYVTVNEKNGVFGDKVLPDDILTNGSVTAASFNYTRELEAAIGSGDATIDGVAANLYTTCLPVAPPTADNVKYYTLKSVSDNTLIFTEVTTPEANTPYLVAVKEGEGLVESQSAENVTLKREADNSTTTGGFVFKGTLTGLTNAAAAAAGAYILQDGNKWCRVTNTNTDAFIPAFRAYIVATNSNASALLNTEFSETTGIHSLQLIDCDGQEHWYDLNGQRIANPVKKGVHIYNGKKVVKK